MIFSAIQEHRVSPTSPSDEKRELRKRSVDNLQRLYTIVTGLSLTVAVGRLIGVSANDLSSLQGRVSGVDLRSEALPMFVSLLVTLLPFYHGANRYLDMAYVFTDDGSQPRPLAAVVDFVLFFGQAVIFYTMALVLADPVWFYWLFVALMATDGLWLAFVYFHSPANFSRIKWWSFLNWPTAVVMFVIMATPLLPDDFKKWGLATFAAVARTVLDYLLQWSFYWPGLVKQAQPGREAQPGA